MKKTASVIPDDYIASLAALDDKDKCRLLYEKRDGYCTTEYTCPECPHLDNDYDDIEIPCRNFIKE